MRRAGEHVTPQEVPNVISMGRGTMGFETWDGHNTCNSCRYADETYSHFRLNIDGIWHYLCLACVEALKTMLDNPLRRDSK